MHGRDCIIILRFREKQLSRSQFLFFWQFFLFIQILDCQINYTSTRSRKANWIIYQIFCKVSEAIYFIVSWWGFVECLPGRKPESNYRSQCMFQAISIRGYTAITQITKIWRFNLWNSNCDFMKIGWEKHIFGNHFYLASNLVESPLSYNGNLCPVTFFSWEKKIITRRFWNMKEVTLK